MKESDAPALRVGSEPGKRSATRTASADRRRTEIAGIAARLFNERGYHSTSMEDIADSVGVRKPTLYHYFKGKEEILFEIHNEMIELILSRHDARVLEGIDSHAATLRALMGDIIQLMETHPGHLRIFFEHYRELPDEYKKTIREKRNRFRDFISGTVRAGIEAGEFLEANVELVTLALLGLSNWTYTWLGPGAQYSAEEVADYFWRILMQGIAANPPSARRTALLSPLHASS